MFNSLLSILLWIVPEVELRNSVFKFFSNYHIHKHFKVQKTSEVFQRSPFVADLATLVYSQRKLLQGEAVLLTQESCIYNTILTCRYLYSPIHVPHSVGAGGTTVNKSAWGWAARLKDTNTEGERKPGDISQLLLTEYLIEVSAGYFQHILI